MYPVCESKISGSQRKNDHHTIYHTTSTLLYGVPRNRRKGIHECRSRDGCQLWLCLRERTVISGPLHTCRRANSEPIFFSRSIRLKQGNIYNTYHRYYELKYILITQGIGTTIIRDFVDGQMTLVSRMAIVTE